MNTRRNLYYIFAADKEAYALSNEESERILKNILEFYKKIKPP